MKKSGILRTLALALAVTMLAIPLSSCGKAGASLSGGSGKDTLTVAFNADPSTLDPHAAAPAASVNALRPVYETLYYYDENNELQPQLATGYERVDDKHWRFTLRDDVYFHNGEKMTANDVLYSFTRAAGPEGAKVSYIMNYIDAANCVVEDEHTIVIATTAPFPLLGYLPYIGAAIVSEKEFVEDKERAIAHPIGTGPFKFVSWSKNDRCTYVRNDEYWGEKPAYKNLVIRTIVEANSRVIELESGTVDIISDVPANDVSRLEQNPDTAIVRTPSTSFDYLGMNFSKAPFDNLDFRLAIDYAIDQNALAASVYRGIAQYTPGVVTPNMKYFNDVDIEDRYDVEKAKELLAKSGFNTNTVLTITTSETTDRINTCTVLQSMLAEIGIQLEVQIYESGTYYSVLEEGNHDFFIGSWGGVGFPEPDNNIYGPFHSNQIPVNNYLFLRDDTLDQMLDEQRSMPDGPEREALVKEIQKYQRDNCYAIPLINREQVMGTRSNVKNFKPTPASSHYYQMVTFE